MGTYECMYCHSHRIIESSHRIDASHSVLEIKYRCGTMLRIYFPDGSHEWQKFCQGVSSQRLDKSRKLPDN